MSNLARIYQAFYTGFNGTPQPTIGQQAGGGEALSLNETGIQTDSTGRGGYSGSEVSATSVRSRMPRRASASSSRPTSSSVHATSPSYG